MASSFNQKSSSSASRAPKPTYRRAAASPRKASAKPAPAARTAPAASAPKASKRPAARKAPSMGGKAPSPRKPKGTLHGSRPVASPAAVRAAAQRPSAPAPAPKVKVSASKVKVPMAKAKASTPKVKVPSAKLPVGNPAAAGRAPGAPAFARPIAAAFSSLAAFVSGLASKLNIPKPSRAALFAGAGAVVALALAAVLLVNSALLAATDIQVRGSAHVDQQTASALVDVPEGTTLLNVDEGAILEQLQASPWVKDVSIERSWPHTLIITPVERQMKAMAYITADEIAWAIGEDGTWIAPVTLLAAVDAEGNEVEVGEDGSVPEGCTLLSGQDAALRVAQESGCLLLTDVPSDVSPKSGEGVSAKVVLAGLEYANGFSPEFVSQIKSLSVASVEAISANLTSGVEVSLGAPDNIVEKERVVTKLLSQETGVTFINVREPGAYTFRSAPQ